VNRVLAILAFGALTVESVYAGGNVAPAEDVVPVPVIVDNSGFYIGGGVSFLNYNEEYSDGVTADVDMNGITLIAGYQFNEYIAIEGRYITGVGGSDEDWSDGRTRTDTNNDLSNLALYVKPSYQFGDFKLYALLGYGQFSYQYKDTAKQRESGFQWGLGAGYNFNDNWSVFVDYTKLYHDTGFDTYLSDTDYDVDAWTVGIAYLF